MAATPTWKGINDSWFDHDLDRLDHRRPDRPDRQDDLRRHRRAERLQRQRGRRRPLQVDRRRRHVDPARRAAPRSTDRWIGAIAVDPSDPQHLLIGTDVARHGASSNTAAASRRRLRRPSASSESTTAAVPGPSSSTSRRIRWIRASSNGGDFFARRRHEDPVRPDDPPRTTSRLRATASIGLVTDGFEQIFTDTESPTSGLLRPQRSVVASSSRRSRPARIAELDAQSARGCTSAPAGTGPVAGPPRRVAPLPDRLPPADAAET